MLLKMLSAKWRPSCLGLNVLTIVFIHIGSQVKTIQSQSNKFKEFVKTSDFSILKSQKPLHVTHLLKLLDKMCKYEMDLVSIVEERI